MTRDHDDQPFGGDGSRYQNWAGKPPHWWNISYDTHSAPQRAVRNVMRLVYTVVAVAVVVTVIKTFMSAH